MTLGKEPKEEKRCRAVTYVRNNGNEKLELFAILSSIGATSATENPNNNNKVI